LFDETPSQARTYYNLYGAMYNNSVTPTSYRGKFHTGIDLTYSSGCDVYAPITGIIRGIDRNEWGTVCIEKSSGTNYTMSHLSSIPTSLAVGNTITKGTLIGKQSNTGLNLQAGVNTHVHFEVTSATNLCTTLNSHSSVAMGSTKVPYSYL
jgi:murein DD-endopeptidase MepM/ murein hydrolase activator NlpD